MIAEVVGQGGARGLARPVVCFAVLTVAVVCFFLMVSMVAFYSGGWVGVVAAAVAAWVCWFAATLALAIVMVFRGPQNGVAGVLGSMVVRMALPLAVGVFLSRQGGGLADAGVFGMIVIFYLFTLALETWLSVSFISRNSGVKRSAA